MKASTIEFTSYSGNQTHIESINYDLDYLKVVVVADSNLRIEVCFQQPIGFRCLDEGDLLEFWASNKITSNWLLQIHDFGWLAQESNRAGFLSKDTMLSEYLIKGSNECLNVLSTDKPVISLV
ncbi:hypothetical protein PMAN_b0219 [Pseudoalteromonas marina]|uniref:hypothetical protein n=1 Tax=Pseudoalteromonas TaxID=53246 RepID=UPI00026D185A|nr:hypothetical protein [Pseudoalteromonas marina]KAF7772637.1 hypothetical protein PMAN_b0219 [Pseudoalteromonas marina]